MFSSDAENAKHPSSAVKSSRKSTPVGLHNHLIFFMNRTFNIISKAHKMGPNKTNNNMAELAIDISIAIDKTIPVGYVTSPCRSTGECGESVGFTLWILTSSKPTDCIPSWIHAVHIAEQINRKVSKSKDTCFAFKCEISARLSAPEDTLGLFQESMYGQSQTLKSSSQCDSNRISIPRGETESSVPLA